MANNEIQSRIGCAAPRKPRGIGKNDPKGNDCPNTLSHYHSSLGHIYLEKSTYAVGPACPMVSFLLPWHCRRHQNSSSQLRLYTKISIPASGIHHRLVTGLEWDQSLHFFFFNSPGNSDVQPELRTTAQRKCL